MIYIIYYGEITNVFDDDKSAIDWLKKQNQTDYTRIIRGKEVELTITEVEIVKEYQLK